MSKTIEFGSMGPRTLKFNSKAIRIIESKDSYRTLISDPNGQARILSYDEVVGGVSRSMEFLTRAIAIGLMWESKKAYDLEKAEELVDAYLEAGPLDGGDRLGDLRDAVNEAIFQGYGMDPMKIRDPDVLRNRIKILQDLLAQVEAARAGGESKSDQPSS